MSCRRELKLISQLEVGAFRGDVIVRVERIIRVQNVMHPLGPHRPMLEQEAVHVVVFDESSKHVKNRVRNMFAEERVLRIRYFDVCLDEATSGGTLYIKVKSVTHVEQVLESDPKYPQALPSHCFDLVTIIEVVERRARGRDVFGNVVTCYERGMEGVDGMDSREVILVLEETGVLATRQPTIVTCVFHGQCADSTIRAYNAVDKDGPIVAVVMFATHTNEGKISQLCEYNDATRAFFNPNFPELVDARKALVDRLCEMYNRNAIPMLPHPTEEAQGSIDHVYLS